MTQKKYICERCKKKIDANDFNKSSGMCQSCFAKNWDDSFSSQSDYSDELFEEQVREEWEANELMNKAVIKDEDIKYFFEKYWIGKIKCRKCSYVRTRWKRKDNPMTENEKQKRIKRLKKKCPKCGVKGYLIRE